MSAPLNSLVWSGRDKKCSHSLILREGQHVYILDTYCSWLMGSYSQDGVVLSNTNLPSPSNTNISLFRPEQSSAFRGVLPCALRGPTACPSPSEPNSASQCWHPVTGHTAHMLLGCFCSFLIEALLGRACALCAGATLLCLSKMFLKGKWLGKAQRNCLLPLFPHVLWCSCRGRLARGGLLHQLSQWHLGLWL